MTAQDKNNRKADDDNRLESILRAVTSIDRNVEDIRDKLTEHVDADSYENAWEHEDYFSSKDY